MIDINKVRSKYPIEDILKEKEELEKTMSDPASMGSGLSKTSVQLNHVTKINEFYLKIFHLLENLSQAYELSDSDDSEMKELAQEDIKQLEKDVATIQEELTQYEIGYELSDPDDSKSAIIEIRAGAGGDEASLFASDLYRMYANYADSVGWKVEMIEANVNESGGYKEVIAHIRGEAVYEKLKYESGVHRVQRIPVTESGGRIHTSTASVAILPEVQEIDLNIRKEDLKIDTMRSSGAGGQSVNKTSSAIRITHLPTGIVASCQDTKVQQQNKDKAMQILRARLYEQEKQKENEKRSSMRTSQIGTAMRAEKIRTYNYPQSRITDHRVKISWHNLETIINGSIGDLLTELQAEMRKLQLEDIKQAKKEG